MVISARWFLQLGCVRNVHTSEYKTMFKGVTEILAYFTYDAQCVFSSVLTWWEEKKVDMLKDMLLMYERSHSRDNEVKGVGYNLTLGCTNVMINYKCIYVQNWKNDLMSTCTGDLLSVYMLQCIGGIFWWFGTCALINRYLWLSGTHVLIIDWLSDFALCAGLIPTLDTM